MTVGNVAPGAAPPEGVIVSSCCAARAPGMVDVTLLQRFIEHMRKSDTCSAQLQRDIGFGLIHIGGVNMFAPRPLIVADRHKHLPGPWRMLPRPNPPAYRWSSLWPGQHQEADLRRGGERREGAKGGLSRAHCAPRAAAGPAPWPPLVAVPV
jgi:hypothetical protein